ncbi:MAG: indole-3-glycerol phosphate synthase TrpC [Alphaproteobacteria bacterium]
MEDVLKKICVCKQEYVELCKNKTSFSDLEKRAKEQEPVRGFIKNLDYFADNHRYALIAEIKKASPSAGLIRKDFNPSLIAREYERAGAACLSVLTETNFFLGNDSYLIEAKNSCSLPILRKDFMLDSYQVVEARAIGADCILLIMAALDDSLAQELEAAAMEYNLDVLVEVHNKDELERALKLKTPLIGINNRNLKTLKTDISVTEELAKYVPQNKKIVSESGLYTPKDLEQMSKVGAVRFLIGQSLMEHNDIYDATKKLLTIS